MSSNSPLACSAGLSKRYGANLNHARAVLESNICLMRERSRSPGASFSPPLCSDDAAAAGASNTSNSLNGRSAARRGNAVSRIVSSVEEEEVGNARCKHLSCRIPKILNDLITCWHAFSTCSPRPLLLTPLPQSARVRKPYLQVFDCMDAVFRKPSFNTRHHATASYIWRSGVCMRPQIPSTNTTASCHPCFTLSLKRSVTTVENHALIVRVRQSPQQSASNRFPLSVRESSPASRCSQTTWRNKSTRMNHDSVGDR